MWCFLPLISACLVLVSSSPWPTQAPTSGTVSDFTHQILLAASNDLHTKGEVPLDIAGVVSQKCGIRNLEKFTLLTNPYCRQAGHQQGELIFQLQFPEVSMDCKRHHDPNLPQTTVEFVPPSLNITYSNPVFEFTSRIKYTSIDNSDISTKAIQPGTFTHQVDPTWISKPGQQSVIAEIYHPMFDRHVAAIWHIVLKWAIWKVGLDQTENHLVSAVTSCQT